METLFVIGSLIGSYIIGAVPFGWVVVKWITGKDIRQVESGRSGGTNAMRAAGVGAGILTAVFDMLKGAAAVWIARELAPTMNWVHAIAPVFSIVGHNYSIFLAERNGEGKLVLRGGAGGAPCAGGALGLWAPSLLLILPIGFLIWWGVGYASLTTISIAVVSLTIFAIRAAEGLSPWAYVLQGAIGLLLLLYALRPNLKRLAEGTERLHGLRAKLKAKRDQFFK